MIQGKNARRRVNAGVGREHKRSCMCNQVSCYCMVVRACSRTDMLQYDLADRLEVGMELWSTLVAIERDPAKVSGAWVFRGTRIPVASLFENLRDGATVDQYLEWFPGVTRAQVDAVLDYEAHAFSLAEAA